MTVDMLIIDIAKMNLIVQVSAPST